MAPLCTRRVDLVSHFPQTKRTNISVKELIHHPETLPVLLRSSIVLPLVPSANALVRWVNENAFAPIVQARLCPTFGRPVHHRGRPHRLRPGTSPHTPRIPPHDGHPVLRSAAGSGFRFPLAVSSADARHYHIFQPLQSSLGGKQSAVVSV
jgi:hypothetical protein